MTTQDETHEEGAEAPPRGVRAMALVRWLLVLGAALAATYSFLSVAGVVDGPRGEAGTWYCPMHPHVVQDHPGECPICFMSLVERGDDQAALAHGAQGDGGDPAVAEHGVVPVEMSPERIQLMGLRTTAVSRQTLEPSLQAVASVGAPETGWSQVTPRFSGWLERVLVTETGVRVKRGQGLATLYSPELLAAQEEYLAAVRWSAAPALPSLPGHGGGEATTPRPNLASETRRRLELFGMSGGDIDTITRTGKAMRTVTLRAPTGGHVLSRAAITGGYVQPGVVLFEIADLSKVWAWIEISERDLGRVALGQPATLTVDAFPGEAFTGKVAFLAPVVDPATRTLRARIELPNRDGRLRPGMSGRASIVMPAVELLALPEAAVIDTGDARYVFVASGGGKFAPREVVIGQRIGGWAELLPDATGALPVAEGEQVVTSGNFLLDAESRLQAQIAGAGGH